MDPGGSGGTELLRERVAYGTQLVAVNCMTTLPSPPPILYWVTFKPELGGKKQLRSLNRRIKYRRGRRKTYCQGTYTRRKTKSINVVLYSLKEMIDGMTYL